MAGLVATARVLASTERPRPEPCVFRPMVNAIEDSSARCGGNLQVVRTVLPPLGWFPAMWSLLHGDVKEKQPHS